MSDPIDQKISQLERRLSQVKVHFEMFISGRERLPPLRDIDQFERDLNRLALEANKRTASKFRLSNLRSKFTSLKSLWMRQLERKETGRSLTPQKATPMPKANQAKRGSNLHQAYNAALAQTGDSRRISKEQLEATLEKQRARLANKYPGKDFEFTVSVRDGKVKLKASPK